MAFPATVLGVAVELALGADLAAAPSTWVWTDVTAYVYVRDLIRITHGRPDGASQSQPDTLSITVNNRDGRWCAHNPTGAWFGQIGRGTPIRVVVDQGTPSTRVTAFIAALPPRWDLSENDRTVRVFAAGVHQRLERSSDVLRSPLVRSILRPDTVGFDDFPIAYWPGEDGSSAGSFAEYFGGPAMTWVGEVSPGQVGPAGSQPLAELTSAAGLSGTVPSHTSTGEWSALNVINVPAAVTGVTTILRLHTNGSLPMWQVVLTPGSPDTISLEAYDALGVRQINDSTIFTLYDLTTELYGTWLMCGLAARQNGTDIEYTAEFSDGNIGASFGGGVLAGTAGTPLKVGVPASIKLDGVHVGHWAVWDVEMISDLNFFAASLALDGHVADSAHVRASRVGHEEGIEVEVGFDSQAMGPQPLSTFLGILRECEAVDGGRLVDSRDPVPFDSLLRLVTFEEIANADPALELNHDSGHLADFEPQDDDRDLRNDFTATKPDGTSGRVVADSGNLTPARVGTYASSGSFNVQVDTDLLNEAGWQVHRGTVEGLRYPQVGISFTRNPSLIPDWITCDVGSRVTISNPPDGMPPDLVDLLVEGWTEILGAFTWDVGLNCTPYAPYKVGELATTTSDANEWLGRLAGDEDSATRAAITSSATTVDVDPNRAFFTLVADDFDPDPEFRLGGEVVTVSGISTTAAAFIAAGTAAHAVNASVTPGLPAGVSAGHGMFLLAAIRNSGAGVPATPTGYTRLAVFPAEANVQLFFKVHSGSESAPTVTFTGGVANADTSAQMCAFSGTPVSLADPADIVVDSLAQLNGSAANIAYPGVYVPRQERCIMLVIGWRQQDWASVATLGGFAEIGEPDTSTGDNQGLVWDYRIDTTPVVIPEGSFTVTGGVAGISRGAVVAIASGYQTFTISARSLNGVTKAHTAGTKIGAEDAFVLSL